MAGSYVRWSRSSLPQSKRFSSLGSRWAAISFVCRNHEFSVLFFDLGEQVVQFRGVLLLRSSWTVCLASVSRPVRK